MTKQQQQRGESSPMSSMLARQESDSDTKGCNVITSSFCGDKDQSHIYARCFSFCSFPSQVGIPTLWEDNINSDNPIHAAELFNAPFFSSCTWIHLRTADVLKIAVWGFVSVTSDAAVATMLQFRRGVFTPESNKRLTLWHQHIIQWNIVFHRPWFRPFGSDYHRRCSLATMVPLLTIIHFSEAYRWGKKKQW